MILSNALTSGNTAPAGSAHLVKENPLTCGDAGPPLRQTLRVCPQQRARPRTGI